MKIKAVFLFIAAVFLLFSACENQLFPVIGDNDGTSSSGGGTTQQSGTHYGRVAYSTDGINWVRATDSVFPVNVRNIAWGNGRFVAVGFQGD